MKKGAAFSVSVLIMVILYNILLPCAAAGSAAEKGQEALPVVRVGFPIQSGLMEVDADGNFSGYTYDYLMEISQYADWTYEFVQVEGNLNTQIATLLRMLEDGEIDLMGAMNYTDELAEQYDYTGSHYGMAYNALCVLNENQELNEYNLPSAGALTVAVMNYERPQLTQFAQTNGLEVEQVICHSTEEQIEEMRSGHADAMMTVNLSAPKDEVRVIACFSPKPFYFAATKGNTQLISTLNTAIAMLNSADPYYMTNLNEKYFGYHTGGFSLTQQEQDFVRLSDPIQVVVWGGRAPVQYMDQQGKIQGVSMEVLAYISEQTGLDFEYQYAATFDEYMEIIKNKGADITAGVIQNYNNAQQYGYALTAPYLNAPLAIVVNDSVHPDDLFGKNLALSSGYDYDGDYLGVMTHYDSIEECLQAVHSGEMDYCYGNSYSVQYYISQKGYQNMLTIPRPERWAQKYCFGVLKPTDPCLMAIMNKAVRSIPEEKIQQMIYRHAYHPEKVTLIDYVSSNPGQAAALAAVIILLLAVTMLLWYIYHGRRNNRQIALDSERYRQVSELSNEYLYEYDIAHDSLLLSEKSAQYFRLPEVTEHFSQSVQKITSEWKPLDKLKKRLYAGGEGDDEILCLLKNGERRWMRVTSKTVVDNRGVPAYSIGKITDIQLEKEEKEQLRQKAQTDSLTQISNAAFFRMLTEKHLESYPGQGTLYMMDMDDFKGINDRFGHYVGDRVLIKAAEVLKEVFQEGLVGRTGGDEFAGYQKETVSQEEAEEKCRQIQKRLSDAAYEASLPDVSLSIGCALAGKDDTYESLYIRADQALYRVKQGGRKGFCIEP